MHLTNNSSFTYYIFNNLGKSMITKKSDGSQVKEKESTDSSTTLEDEDLKGKSIEIYSFIPFISLSSTFLFSF